MKRVVLSVCAAVAAAIVAQAETYTWKVGTTGNWEDAANWTVKGGTPERAPSSQDEVFLPAPSAAAGNYVVTANEAINVASLTVGSDTIEEEGCLATFESKTTAMHQIGAGGLVVKAGGKMTHTQSNDESKKLNLEVGGNVTVMADGLIDVSGSGYAGGRGPGYTKNNEPNASHGGRYAVGKATYGSLISPVTCGSGATTAGGGVIRIAATGQLDVRGTISANGDGNATSYGSGAGGSVWLSGSSLTGAGTISANGGFAQQGDGGAGGRVSVCLKSATGFDSWTGKTLSYGGRIGINWNWGPGSPGTVYLQSGDCGVTNSTTIVDNGNVAMTKDGYVDLNVATESSVLGALIVRNNGRVHVAEGDEIELCGGIDTRGGTMLMSGATVRLVGTAPATICGKQPYGNFICEVPGKTVSFGTTEDDLFEIVAGGSLTLRGSEAATLDLRPDDPSRFWTVKLDATSVAEVFYVSASNSNANAGRTVGAISSEDLGGNANWTFTDPIVPGETITWTGAVDGDWLKPANWDRGRMVEDTDDILIGAKDASDAPITNMPAIVGGTHHLFNRVTIESGASLTLSGGCVVTITNELKVAGTLSATAAERIVCTKDVDFSGGVFSAGASHFRLEGEDAQAINLNGQSFAHLLVEKDRGTVAFADGFAASVFDVHSTDALTIEFAAEKTVEAASCYFRGRRQDGGRALTLMSSAAGTPWKLKIGSVQSVSGVNVSDSDARDGSVVRADASAGAGVNFGWDFDSGIVNASWIGKSGAFETGSNWDTGVAPGAGTNVLIFSQTDEPLKVTANVAISVHDLVVQGGAGSTVTFESMTKSVHRIAGDFVVNTNGVLTHVQSGTAYSLDFDVGGCVKVESGGKIDVKGCGYSAHSGPGYVKNGEPSAAHGGRFAAGAQTYGSLSAPTNCGSGASASGGGVVKIRALGDLMVKGEVNADGGDTSVYGSGAGGSVWLIGKRLSGDGIITANGGSAGQGDGGAGGRIAVWLTEATDFTDWAGRLLARGGGKYGQINWGPGSAGTIYLQTAKENAKSATTIVDNDGEPMNKNGYGYVELKKETGSAVLGTLLVRNCGSVKLLTDVRAADVDLASANVKLNVGTNILTVCTYVHKDGKGWADELDKLVVKEADPTTGKTGDIVWKPQGIAVIIR